jgi:SAM-dependent methyltransferase
MKHNYLFFACSILITLFCACRDTAQSDSERSGLLTQDQTGSDNTNQPIDLFDSGEGNFDALVADYESKDRVIWQKPDIVISLLGDLEDKTIADIGAGTGYFAFRIVSSAKKVIGIDIDPRFVSFMDSVKVHLIPEYRDRFESRLAKPNDPYLAPEETDAIMLVNTYGYIDERVDYLKKLWTGLKPNGQLLIIDFKKNNLPVGPSVEFKVSTTQAQRDLAEAGFDIVQVDRTTLDYQYIILAKKREPSEQE